MEYLNKKVMVLGLARSGAAAAKLLACEGATVTVNDIKPHNKVDAAAIKEVSVPGVNLFLGFHPQDSFAADEFDYIVKSPGIHPAHSFIRQAKEKGVIVLSEVEVAYQLTKGRMIGITGTNGKTTTTALTGEILRLYYPEVYVAGNIGNPLCQVAGRASSKALIVAELSSFQLEDIVCFHPYIAVILNFSPDHLDYHGDLDSYRKAKSNILNNQRKKDYAIANMDDPVVAEMVKTTPANKFVFGSSHNISRGCFVKDKTIIIRDNKLTYPLCSINELNIPGKHNLENAQAAALAAYTAGVPPQVIANGLKQFKGVSHRLEFVVSVNGISIYNDSKATNPVSTQTALQAINGKKVLIAGGKKKNGDFSLLAKDFPSHLSNLILLGEEAERLAAAAEAAGFHRWQIVSNLDSAVEEAIRVARKGETVLLSPACASWDMFANFEERGDYFKKLVFKIKERQR